mgnify:CR=1 FL=1
MYIQFIRIAVYAVEYRPTYRFMQCITQKSMQLIIPENEVKNAKFIDPYLMVVHAMVQHGAPMLQHVAPKVFLCRL